MYDIVRYVFRLKVNITCLVKNVISKNRVDVLIIILNIVLVSEIRVEIRFCTNIPIIIFIILIFSIPI